MIPALRDFISDKTIVTRSPGRINLIGEHTDYNEGFVLPAAIDKAAYLALTPRADNEINLFSVDLGKKHHTTVETFDKTKESWPNYILGVLHQFRKKGIALKGFDAALTADVPIGAGLSSSAAVECATVIALNEILKTGIDKMNMVKMSQTAEHEYPGVMCGIMDQFASMFGKENHVIKLDCRSLEYEYEPFDIKGMKIVLLDTNVKHALNETEYNIRRQQCEQGVAMVQQHVSGVKSLRDVTLQMLQQYVEPFDALIFKRCRYVVEENERLLEACTDLEAGNIKAFGQKMFLAHDAISKQYEVSCAELDFLVAFVKNDPAVIGARMMGGGFGGCTINLVKEEAVESLISKASEAYSKAMNRHLKPYVVNIKNGSEIMMLPSA